MNGASIIQNIPHRIRKYPIAMQAEDNTTRKRKSVNSTVRTADEKGASPRKKKRGPKAAKGKAVEARGWPVYFDEVCRRQ